MGSLAQHKQQQHLHLPLGSLAWHQQQQHLHLPLGSQEQRLVGLVVHLKVVVSQVVPAQHPLWANPLLPTLPLGSLVLQVA